MGTVCDKATKPTQPSNTLCAKERSRQIGAHGASQVLTVSPLSIFALLCASTSTTGRPQHPLAPSAYATPCHPSLDFTRTALSALRPPWESTPCPPHMTPSLPPLYVPHPPPTLTPHFFTWLHTHLHSHTTPHPPHTPTWPIREPCQIAKFQFQLENDAPRWKFNRPLRLEKAVSTYSEISATW